MPDIKDIPTEDLLAQFQGGSDSSNQGSQKDITKIPTDELISQFQGSKDSSKDEPMFGGDEQSLIESNFIPSPIDAKKRFEVYLAKTPKGQLNIAQTHLGLNASLRQDGKVVVQNQDGDSIPITPDAKGWTNFFRDFSGRLSEFSAKNIPIAGQIAGDVAGASMSGGNPAVAIAGGTIGAGAAEAWRQGAANSLGANEGTSPGSIAGEAGLAAAGGTIGEFAIRPLMNGGAKLLGRTFGKLQDSSPEIFKMLADVPTEDTEHVIKRLKSGARIQDVLSDDKADSDYLIKTVNRTFFGDESAPKSMENFIKTYQKNFSRSKSVEVIDAMYQGEHGISKSSLDAMKNYTSKELLSPENQGDEAIRNFGKEASGIFDGMADREQAIFSITKKSILAEKGNYKIPVKAHSQSTLDTLVDRGIFTTDGKGNYFKNIGYEGTKKTQDLYESFFKDMMDVSKKVKTSSGSMTAKEYQEFTKSGIRAVDSIPAADLDKILTHKSTAFDSLFSKGDKYNKENAPMADLLSKMKDSVSSNIGDARWSEMNQRYKEFKNASTLFGKISDRSLESEVKTIKEIQGAFQTKDESVKKIYQDYLARADRFIGDPEKKLTPKFNKLGAGQELEKVDLSGSSTQFEKKLVSSNSNTPGSTDVRKVVDLYDDNLPNRQKFMQDTLDHLASKSFSKNATLYKSRVVGFLMGSFFPLFHGPLGKIASFGAGSGLAQPSNLAKFLPLLEEGSKGLAKTSLSQGQRAFARLATSTGLRNVG